jgi:hypothetical protein
MTTCRSKSEELRSEEPRAAEKRFDRSEDTLPIEARTSKARVQIASGILTAVQTQAECVAGLRNWQIIHSAVGSPKPREFRVIFRGAGQPAAI